MAGGLQKRLERIEGDYRKEALERIKAARKNVAKIVMAAAREKGLKITGRNRDKLYRLIDGEYAKLEVGLREWSKELVAEGVKTGLAASREALGEVEGAELTKFSKELAERVFEIISPGNESQLAGVLTRKMSETDLSNLRKAQRDTERQAILEGWDTGRKARELKARWGELAGGMEEAKFVDAAGKTWDTDTYVEMLVNTTAQRTEREGFMEGLAQNGDDLVKIDAQGSDACGVCADWDGRILSISGSDERFPSYQDAVDAGMFHPNCRCILTRVDEEWDEEEIEEQAKENAERQEGGEEGGEGGKEVTRRRRETGAQRRETGAREESREESEDVDERRAEPRREAAEQTAKPAERTTGRQDGGSWRKADGRTATPRQNADAARTGRKVDIRVLKGGSVEIRSPSLSQAGVTAETREKPIADALRDADRLYEGLQEALDDARARIVELTHDEMVKATEKLRDGFLPHAERIGKIVENENTLSGESVNEWKKAKSFVERTVNREHLYRAVSIESGTNLLDDRAFYQHGTITLLETDETRVMVHELGHHLEESNPHFLQRCTEFLRYRAESSKGWAGKAREMRTIVPSGGYRRGERAISDKFDDPYCGMIYPRRPDLQPFPIERVTPHGIIKGYDVNATELLSMGLEWLYDDPVRFFERDPEYYKFIVNLLKGLI